MCLAKPNIHDAALPCFPPCARRAAARGHAGAEHRGRALLLHRRAAQVRGAVVGCGVRCRPGRRQGPCSASADRGLTSPACAASPPRQRSPWSALPPRPSVADSYIEVVDVEQARVRGLKGLTYLDKVRGRAAGRPPFCALPRIVAAVVKPQACRAGRAHCGWREGARAAAAGHAAALQCLALGPAAPARAHLSRSSCPTASTVLARSPCRPWTPRTRPRSGRSGRRWPSPGPPTGGRHLRGGQRGG